MYAPAVVVVSSVSKNSATFSGGIRGGASALCAGSGGAV